MRQIGPPVYRFRSSNTNDFQSRLKQNEEKVTVGCYVSLILAIVFFSGVAAGGSYAWSVLDFSTLMGSAGKMVGSVGRH